VLQKRHTHDYLTSAATTLPRDKLTAVQLVKRFSALCGTLESSTLFTTVHQWSMLSHAISFHKFPPYCLYVHFNTILIPTPVFTGD